MARSVVASLDKIIHHRWGYCSRLRHFQYPFFRASLYDCITLVWDASNRPKIILMVTQALTVIVALWEGRSVLESLAGYIVNRCLCCRAFSEKVRGLVLGVSVRRNDSMFGFHLTAP